MTEIEAWKAIFRGLAEDEKEETANKLNTTKHGLRWDKDRVIGFDEMSKEERKYELLKTDPCDCWYCVGKRREEAEKEMLKTTDPLSFDECDCGDCEGKRREETAMKDEDDTLYDVWLRNSKASEKEAAIKQHADELQRSVDLLLKFGEGEPTHFRGLDVKHTDEVFNDKDLEDLLDRMPDRRNAVDAWLRVCEKRIAESLHIPADWIDIKVEGAWYDSDRQ